MVSFFAEGSTFFRYIDAWFFRSALIFVEKQTISTTAVGPLNIPTWWIVDCKIVWTDRLVLCILRLYWYCVVVKKRIRQFERFVD